MAIAGRPATLGLAIALLATSALGAQQQRLEALWYSRGEPSVADFIAHADQISIVSPQVLTLTRDGTIKGTLDPRVASAARAHHVKLVPLVMNPGFDQPAIHRVLNDTTARKKALENLGALCAAQHLDGIQFDIENVNVVDRDRFTAFARDAAVIVHKAGCTLSAAVVPRADDDRATSSYHQWIWENWRGAYDYKALADALDFLSYMTYAQHTGNSTPGPVAGYPWMEACLKYALDAGVPPSKISLGLAGYSDWWYPTYDEKAGPRMRGSDISYTKGMELLARSHITPNWDDVQKSPWAGWDEKGVFQYIWLEDARAFAAKLELVKKYGLRGYSVWKLGDEDPKTWEIVK
jgi:spore germination protein YaaH